MKAKKEVKGLINALKHKDEQVRKRAIDVLGEIKDPRAIELLIQSLKDEYFDIKKKAAEILVKIGQPVVELLIQALKDKDRDIRSGGSFFWFLF